MDAMAMVSADDRQAGRGMFTWEVWGLKNKAL